MVHESELVAHLATNISPFLLARLRVELDYFGPVSTADSLQLLLRDLLLQEHASQTYDCCPEVIVVGLVNIAHQSVGRIGARQAKEIIAVVIIDFPSDQLLMLPHLLFNHNFFAPPLWRLIVVLLLFIIRVLLQVVLLELLVFGNLLTSWIVLELAATVINHLDLRSYTCTEGHSMFLWWIGLCTSNNITLTRLINSYSVRSTVPPQLMNR